MALCPELYVKNWQCVSCDLEQVGVAVTVSAEWVRCTLISLNLTYKSTKPQAKVVRWKLFEGLWSLLQ